MYYVHSIYVVSLNLFSYEFQALDYTRNRSFKAATKWIFNHPELDCETPIEEEIKRLVSF